MKATAEFSEGSLSLILWPESEAERRMIGAVIDQPQNSDACVEQRLVSATLHYQGHWGNKQVEKLWLTLRKP